MLSKPYLWCISTCSFRALFISLNPRRVSLPRLLARSLTKNPLKISFCSKRALLFPIGSIVKVCSPSKSPFIQRWPIHLSSLGGLTLSTVGLNVVPLAPVGWIRTSSFAPFLNSPFAQRMKGFQSGNFAKSVSTNQTSSGELLISMLLTNSFLKNYYPSIFRWSDKFRYSLFFPASNLILVTVNCRSFHKPSVR